MKKNQFIYKRNNKRWRFVYWLFLFTKKSFISITKDSNDHFNSFYLTDNLKKEFLKGIKVALLSLRSGSGSQNKKCVEINNISLTIMTISSEANLNLTIMWF